jgi:hypothetical protein
VGPAGGAAAADARPGAELHFGTLFAALPCPDLHALFQQRPGFGGGCRLGDVSSLKARGNLWLAWLLSHGLGHTRLSMTP